MDEACIEEVKARTVFSEIELPSAPAQETESVARDDDSREKDEAVP